MTLRIVAPADGSTGVSTSPAFGWSAPSPAPTGPYRYYVSVWPNGGGGNNGWDYGPMDSSQTSVTFATVSQGASLAAGTQYQWQVVARDANGNETRKQVSFTTAP